MILRLERERRWVTVAADLHGKVFAVAVGNRIQRQVRDAEQQLPQLSPSPVLFCLCLADLLLEPACPLLQLRDIPALPGRLLHFLCHPVGLGTELVGRGDAAGAP